MTELVLINKSSALPTETCPHWWGFNSKLLPNSLWTEEKRNYKKINALGSIWDIFCNSRSHQSHTNDFQKWLFKLKCFSTLDLSIFYTIVLVTDQQRTKISIVEECWSNTYVWVFFDRHIEFLLELCNGPHSIRELGSPFICAAVQRVIVHVLPYPSNFCQTDTLKTQLYERTTN